MLTHEALIARIDAHLAASGETPAAFGRRVAGDGNLLADLRRGRSPRLRLVHHLLAVLDGADGERTSTATASHDSASLHPNERAA